MPDVLPFRRPDVRLESTTPPCQSFDADAVLHEPVEISEIRTLRAQTKEDIRTVIMLLDVALMHGRIALQKMDDPAARRRLETHLAHIEEILDISRVRAVNL